MGQTELLDRLAAVPRSLQEFSRDLPAASLQRPPRRGGWSANDILAHLRACADVWGDYIAAMLAEDGVTLRSINPRTWMKRTDYPALDFRVSLQAYASQRDELLATLRPLPLESWSRVATLKGGGRTRQRSVLFIAELLASHDQEHVDQIRALLGAAATP